MKQMLDIAKELVTALNDAVSNYDAEEEAVRILEKHFKGHSISESTFKEYRERKFPFHTKKFKKKTL